jgi:tetratricopeptide (TPR) repeat protein
MIRSALIVSVLIALFPAVVICGDSEGLYSPFYFGAGARELALGGAAMTDPSPATAAFWNPSLLGRAQRITVGASHCRLFEHGVVYQHLGLAVPTLDFGGFGLSVFRLGADEIDLRDKQNLSTGTTNESRLGLHLGYGRTLAAFDLGLSISLEHQSLAGFSATSSPGINVSALRRVHLGFLNVSNMAIGLTCRNLLRPSMKLAEYAYKQPYAADAGVKFEFIPDSDWSHVANLYASISKVDMVESQAAAGVEYSMSQMISLRGGIAGSKLSAGVGLQYEMFAFDYAFVERDLDDLHFFNISLSFGKSVAERRLAREARIEEEFNSYLSSQLEQRNLDVVDSLVSEGVAGLETGQVKSAHTRFERAMFLASSSGADTAAIARLIDSTAVLLLIIESDSSYAAHMDSSSSNLESGDYLSAKFFAEKALEIRPGSERAQVIVTKANEELAGMTSGSALIEERLLRADSLIEYGKVEEALEAMQAISNLADSVPRINSTLKKIMFEVMRDRTAMRYGSGEFKSALSTVDSAAAIYADHPWCTEMRNRISREMSRRAPSVETAVAKKAVAPSSEIIAGADAAYLEGRQLFESGDLSNAIEKWETVDLIAPAYKSVRTYLIKAYKYLGVELYGKNKLDDAIAIWRKASALDPENEEIADYIKRTESEISKLKELSYEY